MKNNFFMEKNKKILTEEQKIDKAKEILSNWKEKAKEFEKSIEDLKNAYYNKYGK
jgi:hypothetical protein